MAGQPGLAATRRAAHSILPLVTVPYPHFRIMYHRTLSQRSLPLWRRFLSFVAVVGLHALLLCLLLFAAVRPPLALPIQSLSVRWIETPPPAPPVPVTKAPVPLPTAAKPPRTPPPVVTKAPQLQRHPTPTAAPPPLLTAASTATSSSDFSVAGSGDKITAAPQAGPAPAVASISGARFDADYLRNPKPIYPPLSRRHGEEGKVILRVRVSAEGAPMRIEIKQSSGYPRLDEAARSAVEQWRFVPARHNNDPVEASVLVPLQFTLSS